MEHIDQRFWDKEWRDQRTEIYIEQRINCQILKLIKPVLVEGSKVLEIGCVPARRLSILQRSYDLDTYGLDYSLNGLLDSIKSNNNLLCCDLFHLPFKTETFDLVYSLGVIEHFDDPSDAIQQHVRLLKKGGFILITIPNFSSHSVPSVIYTLAHRYDEVKKNHNMSIMFLENFRKLFRNLSLQEIICDYYGPPVLYSPPNITLRRISAKINKWIDRVTIRSRLLSPELIYVGQKH
jgi:SAM-dependent methyltransferase